MSDPININAVNAWSDDEHDIVIMALRPKGEGAAEFDQDFQEFCLSPNDAVQLMDQLYLLTRKYR